MIIGSQTALWSRRGYRRVTGVCFLLVALMLVGGCSSLSLGYRNGSTLAYWWLDTYLDFTPAQSAQVREVLDQWFAWHRRERLPRDLALLEQARREVQGPLSATQVCAWIPRVQQWRAEALARLVPPLAMLVPTLDDDQLARMAERFTEKNDEWRNDYLPSYRQERLQTQLKHALENIERLYGPLDERQKRLLATRLDQSPWQPERVLADRIVRQQQLLQTLRELRQPGRSDAAERLQQALAALTEPVGEAGRRQRGAFLTERCQIGAELHNQITPQQRQHAVQTLRDWQRDLAAYLPSAASAPLSAPSSSALPAMGP